MAKRPPRIEIHPLLGRALVKAVKSGLIHEKFEDAEIIVIDKFLRRIEDENTTLELIELLRRTTKQVDRIEDDVRPIPDITTHVERMNHVENEMSTWDIESLEHFILVYEDDPNKVDEVELAQKELIRKREQEPRRIRPPQSSE